MFILQAIGFLFLCMASISSSVSMNFQKLAQHEILFHDPRTRQHQRKIPLTTSVFLRPLFILAILLSASASALDFFALTWLPPSTVGVFGSASIIVNLIVTRIILFERPTKAEWSAIVYVVIGCLLAITVTPTHDSGLPVPQLLDRPQSYIYIISIWLSCILFSVALEHVRLPVSMQRFGYPFIGGVLGSQNVCLGKYIAYAFYNMHDGRFTTRVDTFIAAVLLCGASIIIHIIWLNKGLEKYDAYFCIIIYQTAWFMFTTLSGIIVYDDMALLTPFEQLIFGIGLCTASYGVKRLSVIHKPGSDETQIH